MAADAQDIEELRDGYGPRHASALVGHAGAEARLLALWNSGRMPHGVMLAGPEGIGKATLAYRFARFVLAEGRTQADAAGGGGGLFGDAPPAPTSLALQPDHPIFRRVAAASHADLFVAERTWNDKTGRLRSEIGVDDVRELGAFFALTAGEGLWRVAIVDAVDQLNRSSANALLKVLEEPPARALLLLVCHAPGAVLATIRSRCQRIDLRALDAEDAAKVIAQNLPDALPESVAMLARLAEGRPGRAVRLAVEDGAAIYAKMTQLLSSLPDLDIGAVHALGDAVARKPAAFLTLGELLGGWLQRMIRLRTGAAPAAEVIAGEGAAMARLGATLGLERWIEVWEKVARFFERADAVNLDKKQVVIASFDILERASRGVA
jgi:DNA polymerase-3 subunit delta'